MRNLGYYEVIAQVLPALLIAVLIEMRAILDLSMRIAAVEEEREFLDDPKPTRWITTSVLPSFGRAYAVYALTCALFVLGEVLALGVVFFGTDGWFVWLAAPITAVAAVELVVLTIMLSFRHLGYRASLLAAERDLKRKLREQAP